MPKVSILLTCYNHFQFLPQAVESIRSQTFRDYEILALDDGSADGSREILYANSSHFEVMDFVDFMGVRAGRQSIRQWRPQPLPPAPEVS